RARVVLVTYADVCSADGVHPPLHRHRLSAGDVSLLRRRRRLLHRCVRGRVRHGNHVDVVFFFQAEDGIRDWSVTGVQTCALPISTAMSRAPANPRKPRCGVLPSNTTSNARYGRSTAVSWGSVATRRARSRGGSPTDRKSVV